MIIQDHRLWRRNSYKLNLYSCSEILKFKLSNFETFSLFKSDAKVFLIFLHYVTTPYLYFSKYFSKVQASPTGFLNLWMLLYKGFQPNRTGLASCCNKCSVSRIVERRRLVGKKRKRQLKRKVRKGLLATKEHFFSWGKEKWETKNWTRC